MFFVVHFAFMIMQTFAFRIMLLLLNLDYDVILDEIVSRVGDTYFAFLFLYVIFGRRIKEDAHYLQWPSLLEYIEYFRKK